MEKPMKLEIFSPETTLFSGDVSAVFFPGTKGSFEVLYDHAAIISSLEKGDIVYRTDEGEFRISITSGFVKNENNHMVACVEQ